MFGRLVIPSGYKEQPSAFAGAGRPGWRSTGQNKTSDSKLGWIAPGENARKKFTGAGFFCRQKESGAATLPRRK
jgi:hypothetical protein